MVDGLDDLSTTNDEDYVSQEGRPDAGFAPWGMTHDGRLVFAPAEVPTPPIGSRFSQYDKNHNVRR